MSNDTLMVIKKARVTQDPKTREVNGRTLVEVNVAVNTFGKSKDRYRESYFVSATFGGPSSQIAAGLRKGDAIGFHGAFLIRDWTSGGGKSGVAYEIPFADGLAVWAPKREGAPADDQDGYPEALSAPPKASGGFEVV